MAENLQRTCGMKSSERSNDAAKFLCPKGLARTGGLLEFLGAQGFEVSELGVSV